MRVMVRPAWAASSCQRRSRPSSIVSSALIFLSGWRAIPGTIAATSQLDWLISMTARRVLACSRVRRDRLKSLCCGMRSSRAGSTSEDASPSPASIASHPRDFRYDEAHRVVSFDTHAGDAQAHYVPNLHAVHGGPDHLFGNTG